VKIRPDNPSLARLADAAAKLGPLLDRIAFVGGCVTGLLLTDPAAAPVRPTLDVDAIIAIASYAEFSLLGNRMREMGFRESRAEGAPVCRWLNGDLIFDLMPTDATILGFSNVWYRPALESATKTRIGEYELRVITAPYFLATKLAAFRGRGRNDFRMSRDLEDIVTVVDGRPELIDEVHLAAEDLRNISAMNSAIYYPIVTFSKPCRDTCCRMRPASSVSGW